MTRGELARAARGDSMITYPGTPGGFGNTAVIIFFVAIFNVPPPKKGSRNDSLGAIPKLLFSLLPLREAGCAPRYFRVHFRSSPPKVSSRNFIEWFRVLCTGIVGRGSFEDLWPSAEKQKRFTITILFFFVFFSRFWAFLAVLPYITR